MLLRLGICNLIIQNVLLMAILLLASKLLLFGGPFFLPLVLMSTARADSMRFAGHLRLLDSCRLGSLVVEVLVPATPRVWARHSLSFQMLMLKLVLVMIRCVIVLNVHVGLHLLFQVTSIFNALIIYTSKWDWKFRIRQFTSTICILRLLMDLKLLLVFNKHQLIRALLSLIVRLLMPVAFQKLKLRTVFCAIIITHPMVISKLLLWIKIMIVLILLLLIILVLLHDFFGQYFFIIDDIFETVVLEVLPLHH